MASIAKIQIIGNLTRDGETGYTPSGAMKFTINVAVNKRRKEDGANFFRVTAWGKLAEVLDTLTQQGALTKGAQVFVAGTFEAREYESNGVTRMSLDVNADDVQLVGSRGDRPGQPPASEWQKDIVHDTVPF